MKQKGDQVMEETLDLAELHRQGIEVSETYVRTLEDNGTVHRLISGIRTQFGLPGEKVKVNQKLVRQALDYHGDNPAVREITGMLKSLQNVGEQSMVVDRLIVDDAGNVFHKVVGSDVKIDDTFIVHANKHIHEFGVLMLHEDRVWFVQFDERDDTAKKAFEVTQEPHRVFNAQLGVDGLSSLRDMLGAEERQAIIGEFAIEDHGIETWGLLYSPWTSVASERFIDAATPVIENELTSRPLCN